MSSLQTKEVIMSDMIFYIICGVVAIGLAIGIPLFIKGMKDFDRSMKRIDYICKNPIWKW